MDRRLAAILVADIVGYSRLMAADEAGTLAACTQRRRDILEPLIREHSGRVVKYLGDGVLVEFASAVNSVAAALALQRAMSEANESLPDHSRIVLRIGVNLGDVIGEGSDIYGDGVNIAARLEALAEPGGICVSSKVFEEIHGKVDAQFEFTGERHLKNIGQPVGTYRVRTGVSAFSRDIPPELALPSKPSIAVLPFTNMSADPQQEYFADGIAEEIITALSRFHDLFVIARNSSFTYKGQAVDIKRVGRELGVRYVLEGSVRKAGDRVRITGQLIDVATGAHLWADRFDGGLEDIFDLQDQVTSNVVGAIAPKITQAEIERSRRKATESLDAYDFYLRGLAAVHQWTKEANEEALSMFTRAIEIDPDFASSYGMAARCYSQRKGGGWSIDPARDVAETGALARRASDLGKDDAVALCTAGIGLAFVVGDIENGSALADRSLELNPNLAWGWLFSGWIKVWQGEPEAAIERLTRALRLSPHDPELFSLQSAMGFAHFFSGRYSDAWSWAEKAIRERPDALMAVCVAAASASLAGLEEQASRMLAQLRRLDPDFCLSNVRTLVPVRQAEDLARLAQGLRKAGLT